MMENFTAPHLIKKVNFLYFLSRDFLKMNKDLFLLFFLGQGIEGDRFRKYY